MDKFVPIHQHLMIKARIQYPISDPELAKQLLSRLVMEIGMVPVTPPQSVYVHDSGNEGLTGSINLATSHIAYHIWEESELLMMDVYSCKCFEVDKVLKFIGDNFGSISDVSVIEVDRITGYIKGGIHVNTNEVG